MGSGSWIDPKTYGGGGIVKLTYGEVKTNYTFFAGYGDVEDYVMPHRGRGRRRGAGPGRGGPSYYKEYNSIIAGAAMSMTLTARICLPTSWHLYTFSVYENCCKTERIVGIWFRRYF